MFPPKALGENPSCLFELLEAPDVAWLVAASLQPLPSSHGLLGVSPLHVTYRTLATGFRAHLNSPG